MTAAPEAGARPAPRRPDWRRAAALLACGERLTDAARQVGCSRSQLSRKRRLDPVFQGWIEEFRLSGLTPAGRLATLRDAVHKAIEIEVGKCNVRMVIWLAERLNMVKLPSERTPGQELRELLSGLSPEELSDFEGLRDTTLAESSGTPHHDGALRGGPHESPDPGHPDSRG